MISVSIPARAAAVGGGDARHTVDAGGELEHEGDGCLAFAGHDGVDRAVAMDENFVGDEADAVAATEDKRFGKELAYELGQVDHLGDVGQIVDAESQGIGLEAENFALEFAVVEDLKVDQSHLMPGAGRRRRHIPFPAVPDEGKLPNKATHWDAPALLSWLLLSFPAKRSQLSALRGIAAAKISASMTASVKMRGNPG